ncbi:MAG: LacI family DNA-binding transcriptional regulator [Opitutus sp.]
MRSLNQQLLAERLNVSRTTVSRSLANHPAISAETREKVQKLAAEMGYHSNPARGVRRSRQSKAATIGVLIGVPAENVALATFPFILQGIRERAEIEHLAVDVCFEKPASLDPTSKRQRVFRHIRAGDWRGTILIYPFPEEAVDLIARKISTVAVLESYASSTIDIIDTDDTSAMLTLVTRLKDAGHRCIGFITHDYPVGGHWSLRRFGGYVEALFHHGLEFRQDWVVNISKTTPHLRETEIADFVVNKLRQDHVTAWVCAADHQAYSLMHGLQQRGIRVPEDCSVTGFDGLEPPANMRRVTSMLVPHEDIGSSAVARLYSRMMHPSSPRRKILVEARLVEGETIAAPSPV